MDSSNALPGPAPAPAGFINMADFAAVMRQSFAGALADNQAQRGVSTKNHAQAPEHFDGRKETYETFRRGLDLYVKALPSDKEKITAALTFLTKGEADSFAQLWVQNNSTALDAGQIPWSAFLVQLDQHFLDPRLAEYARDRLFRLHQRGREADAFFLEFDDLRLKGGLVNEEHHDVILVEYLKKALNPNLVLAAMTAYDARQKSTAETLQTLQALKVLNQDQVDIQLAKLKKPISYATFRELALANDPTVRRFHHPGQPGHQMRAPAEPRRAQAPVVVHHTHLPAAPVPAAVAPRESAPAREPDVVPMEIDRACARATKVCYRCHKPGHIARDCTERDMREVIRGLTPADLEEIARNRHELALACVEEKAPATADEANEDFVPPQ